jgi:hypothetical protein
VIFLHLFIIYQEIAPAVNGRGAKRSAQILFMEKSDEQITMQGFELGMGWTQCCQLKLPGGGVKALNVIPAKAGIQCFQVLWTPAPARLGGFAGVTVWTDQIFLKLTALGWTLAIDRATGKAVITFANREEGIVIFGACTAQ